MCHDQLAVAVYGIEQLGGVAANMLFHFDAWVKYILIVEFQLGVVSVEVQSVQHNRVLFSFHDFGSYQAQGRILHIGVEKCRGNLAVSGKGMDVERACLLHHHFGFRAVFVPLLHIGDNQPQGESERIVDSDVLIYTFYFDIGGHFTRFDGYGVGKKSIVFSFHGIAFLVHHFYGERAVIVGPPGSGYGDF